MADDKKKPVIIVKKIIGGHAGAHGGAWKVAYADFVTAMMAFFMVMWLLGSDEEIKAAVAAYFNNPASAMRPDMAEEKQMPLGDRTGIGESLNRGLDGMVSEDMVQRPERRRNEEQGHSDDLNAMAKGLLNDNLPPREVQLEHLRFTIPEAGIFVLGSDHIKPDAEDYLKKVGQWLRRFEGKVVMRGFAGTDEANPDDYEFTVARTVSLMKYLVKNKYMDQERISPVVDRVKPGSVGLDEPKDLDQRKVIELTLTR